MTHEPKCQKCSAAMEQGFTIDYARDRTAVQRWTPGIPDGVWFGEASLRQSSDALKIVTWRCTNCGFLESYARVSHLKEPAV